MGLCPSNMMVKGVAFPNYAGRADVDSELSAELEAAGIEAVKYEFLRKRDREVKTAVVGQLGPWGFERAWYYWVATGPGVPPDCAMKLYATHGEVVRVEGGSSAPTPLEYNKGFGVGCYHVDTADGLKALADTLREVMKSAAENVSEQKQQATEQRPPVP